MKAFTSSSRLLKSLTAFALVVTGLASTLFATVPGLPLFYYTGVDLGAAGWRYSGPVGPAIPPYATYTGEWAVFALSGGVTITATTGGSAPGLQTIVGDIGAGGGGNVSISGYTFVNGRAYIRNGGTLIRSGLAKIVGSGTLASPAASAPNDRVLGTAADSLVDTGAFNANNASTAASLKPTLTTGVTPTGWLLTSTAINQATDISLTDNTPGQKIVLNLTDFILSGGATFELHGTQYTSLVINISNTLSLVGAKIKLFGVLGGNVLFNVIGSGSNVTLTSGALVGDTSLDPAPGQQNAAIILAPGRQANISGGSVLNGSLIAAKVNISGNSRVIKPTWLSP